MTKKQLLSITPEVYHQMISDVIDLLKKNRVKITIQNTQYVEYAGNCLGFFGGDVGEMEFAVAVNNPLDLWMPTFIHESCHLDQFLEDKYIWETVDPFLNYYFSWVAGELELQSDRLRECMVRVQMLEKDCEERAVGKIKKYNLPINTTEYIQKANTYLYSYILFTEKRKFIEGLHANPKIFKHCPKHFVTSYNRIPIKIRTAMDEHISQLSLEAQGQD